MIKVLTLVLALTVAGCSWMDVVDFVMPSKNGGIDTELVLGDKQEEIKTEIGAETNTYTAETIVNNVTESANIGWIIFGIIGFMLPTPTRMYYMWKSRGKRS